MGEANLHLKQHGLHVHMDGARLANAVTALGCTPAEMTVHAGIDVLSFGASKDGALAAEAVVFFKPAYVILKRIQARCGNYTGLPHAATQYFTNAP